MSERPHSPSILAGRGLAGVAVLVALVACASRSRGAEEGSAAPLDEPEAEVAAAVEPSTQESDSIPPSAVDPRDDPLLRDLLLAQSREPRHARPAAVAEGPRSRCMEIPDDAPQEYSRCVCEITCARTIDLAALARRLPNPRGAREDIDRLLNAEGRGSIRYPYVEVDGLWIEFDRDGRVTQCSHSVARIPGSAFSTVCPAGSPAGAGAGAGASSQGAEITPESPATDAGTRTLADPVEPR
ncbi:MAG: hypothetical protein H6711_12445 [Myxococcales bacterium]|nr:hypothetical protein [Myxococcales bacterium]